MKVKLTKTGDVVTVSESYGMRLIEQGKAVPHKEKPAASKPAKKVLPHGAV